MATFLEAMQAAREGKRVTVRPLQWMKYHNGSMWYESGNAVHLDPFIITNNHEWQIEPPPPREYTFLEAVEMMEKGKKMKCLNSEWIYSNDSSGFVGADLCRSGLPIADIKGKWIEVQP